MPDSLTGAAGKLFPHGLGFPLPWHHLQGLSDVLAELGEFAAAAGAGARRGNDHALAAGELERPALRLLTAKLHTVLSATAFSAVLSSSAASASSASS